MGGGRWRLCRVAAGRPARRPPVGARAGAVSAWNTVVAMVMESRGWIPGMYRRQNPGVLLQWALIGVGLVRHPRESWNEPPEREWVTCTWV